MILGEAIDPKKRKSFWNYFNDIVTDYGRLDWEGNPLIQPERSGPLTPQELIDLLNQPQPRPYWTYDRGRQFMLWNRIFKNGYMAYSTMNWAQKLGWDQSMVSVFHTNKNLGLCSFLIKNQDELYLHATELEYEDFMEDPTGLQEMITNYGLEMHAYGTVHKVVGKPTWNTIYTGHVGGGIVYDQPQGYLHYYAQRHPPYGYNSQRVHITPNIRTPEDRTPRGKRGYTITNGSAIKDFWGLPGKEYTLAAYEYTLWGDINASEIVTVYPFQNRRHYYNDIDPFWNQWVYENGLEKNY